MLVCVKVRELMVGIGVMVVTTSGCSGTLSPNMCSSNDVAGATNTADCVSGGAPSTGGASLTGGAPSTGGASSTGGNLGAGGDVSTGCASRSGPGGARSTGGESASGGTTAGGGAATTGGTDAGQQCSWGFARQVVYSIGDIWGTPRSVVAGDFDGDGASDIAVANGINTSNIGILLNNGLGTFAPMVPYDTGANSSPESLAAGDFNGDSKLDIAEMDYNSPYTSLIFLNDGKGVFASQMSYNTYYNPEFVTVGDFNSDGHPDLVLAYSGQIGVLLNTSTGTFAEEIRYGASDSVFDVAYPNSIAVGDFDNDGHSDLAVAKLNSHYLSVFMNTGAGEFDTQVPYSTGENSIAMYVATGDINGDGYLDLAVASSSNGSGNVGVFMNTGTGTFAPQVIFSTGDKSVLESIAVGNFNDDAYPDIAVADVYSDSLGVFLNDGTGTFGPETKYSTGDCPISLAVGDFNADGHSDLVVGNNRAGSLSVFLAKCN